MPQEIEIKLKVPDHDPIRRRLEALAGKRLGQVRETNIFFDRPDSSLRIADSGLRVRLTTPAPDSPPEALLTFKGPPQKSGLHSREAYDLAVTPRDQLIPLLAALGFQRTHSFEKDRESWQAAGCRIELDTLPHFGAFLEIEGPSETAVHAVQEQLGLAHLSAQTQSYAEMTADYLKQQAPQSRELRF